MLSSRFGRLAIDASASAAIVIGAVGDTEEEGVGERRPRCELHVCEGRVGGAPLARQHQAPRQVRRIYGAEFLGGVVCGLAARPKPLRLAISPPSGVEIAFVLGGKLC